MPCRSALMPKLRLLVLLLAVTSIQVHAVCAPQLTDINTKLTVGYGWTMIVLYIPETTTAVGVAKQEIVDWDTTATGTINPNVRAGNAASNTWAGDQVNGASARFDSKGGILKPDGTMVYFSIGNALAHITLSGNYPVALFAGDQLNFGCAEGDGTSARFQSAEGPAIADALLVPVYNCHRLALVETNSPHTSTWKVGTGSFGSPTAAGYGTSAPIKFPKTVTSFRNRFYASDTYLKVFVVHPAANWRVVIISDGTATATTNDNPFDNTYTSSATFYQGSLLTWSNCWLHLFQRGTQVGHIVDPEGGNMFLLAGIASGGALFASADLNGNVWVSGHAGNDADLAKHSVAYTGCPAMSPNKCKWGTATATLQEVPPRTRTATPPMTTPAPMTTAPVTTTAVSASASASSSGAATIAAAATVVGTSAATEAGPSAATVVGTSTAATSAAATTAAASTAVVGTTAAATTTAATTTAVMSTTAGAGSTSSSSGFTGNGASSVTAAALGLVTMVLAMF